MKLQELKDALLDRAPKGPERVGCFLCGWILEDLHENGRLTDHPEKSIDGTVLFPPKAKVAHLRIEGFGRLLEGDGGA